MEFACRPKLACSSLQIILTFWLPHPLRVFSFHSGRGNSQIPILRMIEPAAHTEPAQSSPEVVSAVRFSGPLRIWSRLHSATAAHGHLLPHTLSIESGGVVGRLVRGGGGGGELRGRGGRRRRRKRRRGGGGGGRHRHHRWSGGPSGVVHRRRAAARAITRSPRRRRRRGMPSSELRRRAVAAAVEVGGG